MEMQKINCWEAKKCGRQVGGAHVAELGVCPASMHTALDGFNGGKNGGRACWAVTGTLCNGKVEYYESKKWVQCRRCAFFWQVHREEGKNYAGGDEIMEKLFLDYRLTNRIDPRITAYIIMP